MKKAFILFILLNLIMPQVAYAAPPIKYNEVSASAGSGLAGKVFVDSITTNMSAELTADNRLKISSTDHKSGVEVKLKWTALNVLNGWSQSSARVQHINDMGVVDSDEMVRFGAPDLQGFVYLVVDFSSVIIGGVTGTSVYTGTNVTGNQTITFPFGNVNVSSVDFIITNYMTDLDLYGNDKYIDFSPNESMISGTNSDLPLQGYFNISSGISTDGGNARVYYFNGTEIPREIESYSGGNLSFFFKPDVTDNTTNVTYRLMYGNLSASDHVSNSSYGSQAVWDSNYVGVWHMNNDPSEIAPQLKDSTSNGNDGTSSGTMTDTDLVDFSYGTGIDFDGTDDYFDLGADASLNLGGQGVSMFASFKTDATIGTHRIIEQDYHYGYVLDTLDDELRLTIGGTTFVSGDTGTAAGATAANLATGIVYNVHMTWDEIDGKIYNNGEKLMDVGMAETMQGIAQTYLGRLYSNLDLNFDGVLYEARIAKTIHSDGYATTTYNNLNNPSVIGVDAFYKSVTTEQIVGVNVSITASVTGDSNTSTYQTGTTKTFTLTPTANISEIQFVSNSTDWSYIATVHWTENANLTETASNGVYEANLTASIPLTPINGYINYTLINSTYLNADFSNPPAFSTNDSGYNASLSNLTAPDISIYTSGTNGTYYYSYRSNYFYPPSALSVIDFNHTWVNISWVGDGRADAYSVYRNGAFITNTTDLYYNHTGLIEGASYILGVSLWNGSQESSKTALVQSTINPNGTKITFLDLLQNSDTEFHIYNASGYLVTTVSSNGSAYTLSQGAYVVQVLPSDAGYRASPIKLFELFFIAVGAVFGFILLVVLVVGLLKIIRKTMEVWM